MTEGPSGHCGVREGLAADPGAIPQGSLNPLEGQNHSGALGMVLSMRTLVFLGCSAGQVLAHEQEHTKGQH